MGILDQVTQMKNQGIPDQEIITNLQQQGISPREINDALSQAQIKEAVTDEPEIPQESAPEETMPPSPEEQYTPQEEQYYQEPVDEGYAPQESNSDIIIEIANQVIAEKTQKMQKQLEDLNEFKTLSKVKIDNIDERLKKIETTIDKLQIAILDKVGSYGKNLSTMKKELAMVQSSFRKARPIKKSTRRTITKTKKKTISKKKR